MAKKRSSILSTDQDLTIYLFTEGLKKILETGGLISMSQKNMTFCVNYTGTSPNKLESLELRVERSIQAKIITSLLKNCNLKKKTINPDKNHHIWYLYKN